MPWFKATLPSSFTCTLAHVLFALADIVNIYHVKAMKEMLLHICVSVTVMLSSTHDQISTWWNNKPKM